MISNGASLKIRIQSIETGLFLTRTGKWAGARRAVLCTEPVEAVRICVRLGVKKVRFTVRNGKVGPESYVYPFGGDPAVKLFRRQVRKRLTEERRLRASLRLIHARIGALERATA